MSWLVPAALLFAAPAPIVPEPKEIGAVRTVDAIVVDGKATEKTWARARFDDRFVERTPVPGATPPVKTRFKVAFDDQNLYFYAEMEHDPGDLVVRTLRRDNGGIFADDTIILKIDAAHNHRDAVSLGINPDGAQIDSLGLDDGRQFITEWDAVWYAETTKLEDRWTAEFRVPYAVLGIRSADSKTLGLNITRDHSSRNATYDWALIVPPRSPMAASQFGDLVGVHDVAARRAIEYTPYAVLRTNFQPGFTVDPRRRPNFASGADLRVQVGAASYIETSFLTDFAQVEADAVQVARDRFPLFFPERRPFFINGLDVFAFGREREAQLFFSRRVGLEQGQFVPIAAGAKVYGRSANGRVQYGVLEVQTLGAPGDPTRDLPEARPDNVAVGRVRVQATRGLNIGTMILGRHRFASDFNDDAAAGVDARLIAADGRLLYYGFLAGTLAQDAPAQTTLGASAYSFLEYRGLYVRPNVLWLWSDDRFDPRLGFYRRPGSSRQQVGLNFVPRPNVAGLREVNFGPAYSTEFDPSYANRLGQSGGSNFTLSWRNGSQLSYEWRHFVDEVAEPFTLYLHTVEARRYTGFRQAFRAESPGRRAIQGSARYEFIELFGGRAHQPSANLTARLGRHFTIGGGYTHLVGHLADRDARFNFGFSNGNVDVALTRNLAFDNLVRLDLSPGNQRVGWQSRLRWRFVPGSDLFVVYRANIPTAAVPIGEELLTPFHEITVKLTYYLRSFVG